MSQDRRTSFVIRVAQDRRGQVSGVIERVATGAKEAFTGMEAIGQVISRMLQGTGPLVRDESGAPPASGECDAGRGGQS